MNRLFSQPNYSLDVRQLGDYKPPEEAAAAPATPPGRIEFRCPACGQRLQTQSEHVGKTGRCGGCKKHFPIPGIRPPSEAPPPAP